MANLISSAPDTIVPQSLTLQDIINQYNKTVSAYGSSITQQPNFETANSMGNDLKVYQQNFNNYLQQVQQLGLQKDPQALNLLKAVSQSQSAGEPGAVAGNQLNTYLTQYQQQQYQQKQLQQITQQEQAAAQAARTQMLAQIPDEMNTLNTNLVNTEQQAMTQLQPQIDQRLNALGLLNSGALPQAYAQAQTGLDIARENQLNNFQMNAMNQIGNGIPLNALQSQLGNLQATAQNNIDLSQQGAARNYSLQDVADQEAYQTAAQQRALYAARQSQPRQNNTLGEVMGGIGAATSIAGAPFTGGASLAGLPSSIGMIAGGGQGAQMGSTMTNPMLMALAQMRQQPNYYGTGASMSGTGSGMGLNLGTTPTMGGWS